MSQKPNKYRNQKVEVDGETFDSKREYEHWKRLKAMEDRGEISLLERQVRYDLHVNGQRVAYIVPDFRYVKDGVTIVADVKGGEYTMTPVWRLKRKMLKAEWNIDIEVML